MCPKFPILVITGFVGFFKSGCGLCQEDQITSYLFIIDMEALSSELEKMFRLGQYKVIPQGECKVTQCLRITLLSLARVISEFWRRYKYSENLK